MSAKTMHCKACRRSFQPAPGTGQDVCSTACGAWLIGQENNLRPALDTAPHCPTCTCAWQGEEDPNPGDHRQRDRSSPRGKLQSRDAPGGDAGREARDARRVRSALPWIRHHDADDDHVHAGSCRGCERPAPPRTGVRPL